MMFVCSAACSFPWSTHAALGQKAPTCVNSAIDSSRTSLESGYLILCQHPAGRLSGLGDRGNRKGTLSFSESLDPGRIFKVLIGSQGEMLRSRWAACYRGLTGRPGRPILRAIPATRVLKRRASHGGRPRTPVDWHADRQRGCVSVEPVKEPYGGSFGHCGAATPLLKLRCSSYGKDLEDGSFVRGRKRQYRELSWDQTDGELGPSFRRRRRRPQWLLVALAVVAVVLVLALRSRLFPGVRQLPFLSDRAGRPPGAVAQEGQLPDTREEPASQSQNQNHCDHCKGDQQPLRTAPPAAERRAEFPISLIPRPVSYTHLRAHETRHDLVCRLLL